MFCFLSLYSLFIWSNETLNIWSHLAGLFIFIYLLLYDNIIVIPANNGSLADHVIITLGIFCFQVSDIIINVGRMFVASLFKWYSVW